MKRASPQTQLHETISVQHIGIKRSLFSQRDKFHEAFSCCLVYLYRFFTTTRISTLISGDDADDTETQSGSGTHF